MIREKGCAYCGASFIPRDKRQVNCSTLCKNRRAESRRQARTLRETGASRVSPQAFRDELDVLGALASLSARSRKRVFETARLCWGTLA